MSSSRQQKKTIYTLGTSTHSRQSFLSLLKTYQIEQVIDVRRFSKSRFAYFNRENLAPLIQKTGTAYLYLGEELGGYRKGGYEKYTQSPDFNKAVSLLAELASNKCSAILCAEKFAWKCHRRYIARHLQKQNFKVIHIIDKNHTWIPKH